MSPDKPLHRVTVEPIGEVLAIEHGETLMGGARRLGYRWPTLCDGEGSCTICAVEILANADALTAVERSESAAMRFCRLPARSGETVRLACQARVVGDLAVLKKGVKKILMTTQKGTMMSNVDIVREFLAGMQTPISQVRSHLREFMTDDCVWGNAGFPPAMGIEDITTKHELSQEVFGDYRLHIQVLHIAESADGAVLTERIDVGRTEKGEEILTVLVTGVFELRNGKICRWVDYFDPTGLLSHLNKRPEVAAAYFTGKSG